ncbi:DNA primase [Sphingomonas sp.]|uniref:DNA primase n=1 Tax=Sphingomonas sp. TaxID=28214 RepID=UPI002C76BAD6|nr:DNA primase [Sphingomonas sp.]HTG38176.1 DNA primase [Sphingomonas sp.]
MSLTPAFLDEVRARTTLSVLVGRTVKLQRAGREFRACCPFHNEKSPSFYVNDDKGFYHCFGCGAHGDAIRWLTEQQGLPFIDAVKELAQVAGLEMPAQDKRAAEKAERAKSLHDVMAAAAKWYEEQLYGLDGADARALLERRGIRADTARTFGLGFAPDSRTRLRQALSEFGDAMLVEAGLLIQVDGKAPYDRFRGRLMIPIRDPRGRVIAFGGRIIGAGEPKYLNSPETPLFDKGRTLYNLDRAAPAARKAGRVIAVEGYMDVIALAQAGFGEAVAPLGTAMTEAQLERMWRLADVPVMCFDGDAAGQKAAIRTAERALPTLAPGRSLSFVTLPAGQDPDDLIRASGPGAMEVLLAKPEPLVERLWRHALSEPTDTPEERAGLRARLAEQADLIADTNVRTEYHADFRRRFFETFAKRPAPPPRSQARTPQRGRFTKGGWQPPEAPPGDEARAVGTGGIDRVLARAVLCGLIRHPAEIARHMEVLGSLRLADGALARAFEAVVDLALEDQALDSTRLVTILAGSGFDQVASDLLRADALPFSFTQAGADDARAAADLNEAIAVMVARPRVDAALAEATSAMAAHFTGDALARQQALLQEQQRLKARLEKLAHADEDDETIG